MIEDDNLKLKLEVEIQNERLTIRLKALNQRDGIQPTCNIAIGDHPDSGWLNQMALEVSAWLSHWEDHFAERDPRGRAAWMRLFSESSYLTEFPEKFLSWKDENGGSISARFGLAIFFQGLYAYLKHEDRWQVFGSRMVYLYAVWQHYHLLKSILDEPSRREQTDLVNALAQAHRELAQLLETHADEFTGPARLLATHAKKKPADTDLLVYRMRLQMVFESPLDLCSPQLPIFSPEALYQPHIAWDEWKADSKNYAIELHPIFRMAKGAVAALRALASDWALKRYDFETALRLANLQTGLRLNTLGRPLSILLLVCTVLILGLTTGLSSWWAVLDGGISLPLVSLASHIWPQWLGYGGVLFILLRYFNWRMLSRLVLPRLVGGILIGYSAIILQEDPVLISSALWSQGGWQVILLWIGVIAFAVFYLYNEIRPYGQNWRETTWRAFLGLLILFLYALVIGIWLLVLPTVAYSGRALYPEMRLLILGPIGWVDLYHWLVFAPMALFVGLVTQFLFEDKTITTSAWMAEKE